jgi:hypothetical protein
VPPFPRANQGILGNEIGEIARRCGRRYPGKSSLPAVGGEAELPPDRGLHAVTIENLTFNFGSGDRLGTHSLDGDRRALLAVVAARGFDELSTALQASVDGADRLLGTVLACDHRGDLLDAGKNNGNCAFIYHLPLRLPEGELRIVRVAMGRSCR